MGLSSWYNLSVISSLDDRTPLSPNRVAELLELCLKSAYFSYSRDFYEQQEGAVMGYLVSATVANLYMGFFEDIDLKSSPMRPRLWKRYVDETFCIINRGQLQNSWTISMDYGLTFSSLLSLRRTEPSPFLTPCYEGRMMAALKSQYTGSLHT